MADTKHPAEVLADVPGVLRGVWWCNAATEQLHRIPALEAANAAFAARQEWWNNKMVELEAERDALKEKLDQSVHGHNQIFDLCKQMEAERDQLRATCAEWEAKAMTWLASPEAAQRLAGYRDLGRQSADAMNERDQLHAEVMEQARLLGMSGERELALRSEIDRLRKDVERLDWLADPENTIGNVQLPRECVEQNLHSLRDAIDAARKMK